MEADSENLKDVIQHLAIIMDGNGRWAQQRGYNRSKGHRAGADAVKNLLDYIEKYGIKYITLFAFSTENWKRPKVEVSALMDLLKEFLDLNVTSLMERGIKLRVIGRYKQLPLVQQKVIENAIKKTSNNTNGELILALNYGGKSEIVDAAKNIATDFQNKKIKLEDIDEKLFSSYLYAPDIPDPDLLIRTSGEFRLSNFLLWELCYSEIWITNTLWPDFNEETLREAIKNYKNRKRKYGGI